MMSRLSLSIRARHEGESGAPSIDTTNLLAASATVYPESKKLNVESYLCSFRGRLTQAHYLHDIRLNLRGLKCPLPALKTRKALKGLAPGDLLTVECTDPLAAIDIPNLARETGDALEMQTEDGGVLTFRIRKAERATER